LTAGISFAVTPRIILGFEADYRVLFTDYLDDIANDRHPDFDNLLLQNDQAALLTNRAWEIAYDPDAALNPIDVPRNYYQSHNLTNRQRSVGTSNDVFAFLLFKISFLLEDFTLGGKTKFWCYKF